MGMQAKKRWVHRYRDGTVEHTQDYLTPEEPLEIRLGEVPIAVVMRTPGEDEDLIRGFLLTEAILLSPEELVGLDRLDENRWTTRLGVEVDPEQFRRSMFASSSCGVCGKASIDTVRIAARPLPEGPMLSSRTITKVMSNLAQAQPRFTSTGGLHAAGLFNTAGAPLVVREDVGRHNAVDKTIGAIASTQWPLGETILGVSGRLSFEITQKAAVAGIPIIAGISAASSLAAELAQELGITLIGFARQNTHVIYTHPERIIGS